MGNPFDDSVVAAIAIDDVGLLGTLDADDAGSEDNSIAPKLIERPCVC
jgi:hypothetical protein